MKKEAKNLSRAERLEIGILLEKGYSLRGIARALCRSPNTLSYEIQKNRTNGVYEPLKAHAKARLRKRMRRLEFSKIEECPTIKRFITVYISTQNGSGCENKKPRRILGYRSALEVALKAGIIKSESVLIQG